MYTRATNSYLRDNVLSGIAKTNSDLLKAQSQVSTGLKITRASDNVKDAISIVSTNNSLNKISSYLDNINTAQSELNQADTVLTSTVDNISTIKALITQALSSTTGEDELATIKTQVDQIIEEVKAAANTKVGSNYIFGGTVTNTAPYTTSTTGTLYVGSASGSGSRSVEISDGVTVPINLTGDSIFGYYNKSTATGTGLLKTLYTLSDQLGASTLDTSALQINLSNINNDLQTVIKAQTKLGCISNNLTSTQTILNNNQINLKTILSNAQDADITTSATNLQLLETTYESSLSACAKVMSVSLLDYL